MMIHEFQDHSNCLDSSTLVHGGNGILLDAGVESTAEGHQPKIRKPYTMTKQRERWTEEDHKKFLEALKLYGRAWRKIEEHVGTKTAVQIRSHAQKFFSKVFRESDNNSDSSSIKPVEIPPPRPKRKPMHPYPRKLVLHVQKDVPLLKQSARSASPSSSLDQEDQSPTSVLPVIVPDALGSANSCTRESSSSPDSSRGIVDHDVHPSYGGHRIVQENVPQMGVPVSVELELVPMVSVLTKEGTVDTTLPKVFKLFGKTVLLGNSEEPSFSSPWIEQKLCTHAVDLVGENDEKSLNERSSPMEVGPSAPVPLSAFCGGMPFPFIPSDNMNSIKEEVQEEEIKKEKSLPGLNSGSVNAADNCVKKWDTETQSHQYSIDSTRSQQSLAPALTHSDLRPNLKRAISENYMRAFVPYKRSLSERVNQSLKMTCEESDPPRTRLCL